MDFQNTDLRGGSLQISTEVIGKIARCAALEIDGVAEVSCGRQNKKLKDLLEASSIQSPVVVEMRDGTANITLNLMMSFGARIPAVAEKVQENVKNAVQNMTNVTVSRVNLVIAGLAETTLAREASCCERNIMENILPRREARENAFLLAFSQTFGDIPLAEAITSHEENDEEHPVDGFSKHLLNAYYDHSAEVDDEIRAHLRNWTMERLPRVSLTILRLAVAEMLFGGENKPGVAINEAVELTKKYGADEDYQFVNGLLGAVARDHGLDAEQAEQ